MWYKFIDVLELLAFSIIRVIALMIEVTSTSEISVDFYQTTQHNSEDNRLHTYYCENLKSHLQYVNAGWNVGKYHVQELKPDC